MYLFKAFVDKLVEITISDEERTYSEIKKNDDPSSILIDNNHIDMDSGDQSYSSSESDDNINYEDEIQICNHYTIKHQFRMALNNIKDQIYIRYFKYNIPQWVYYVFNIPKSNDDITTISYNLIEIIFLDQNLIKTHINNVYLENDFTALNDKILIKKEIYKTLKYVILKIIAKNTPYLFNSTNYIENYNKKLKKCACRSTDSLISGDNDSNFKYYTLLNEKAFNFSNYSQEPKTKIPIEFMLILFGNSVKCEDIWYLIK